MSTAGGQPDASEDPEPSVEQIGGSAAAGSVIMIFARAAVLPAGMIASAFLARVLGPTDFGVFSVALSIIVWVHMTISMFFGRASIKLLSEAIDWEPMAAALIQVQLLLGLVAGLAVFLAAPSLAAAFGLPALRPMFRVLSLSIPIRTLAQAHRHTLNGRRNFRRSALLPVVSEVTWLLLVLVLVSAGLGLTGAALALLGAASAQLWFALRSLRLPLWKRNAFPRKLFLQYSLPLSLDTGTKRLHKRIDLWAVQFLAGATPAGYYSAALSFRAAGDIFSQGLYPVVLATVSEAWAQGRREVARPIIRQSLRLSLWLLPFAALGAGAAPELIALVFGDAYLPASPILSWVSFSIVAMVVINVTTSVFAAVGRPGAAFAFNGPLLVVAVIGYLVLIPRFGAIGAAATTAATAWAVALASMFAVYRWCQAGPSLGTVVRILLTSIMAAILASRWCAPGGWVILQLVALCGFVLLSLVLLGEASRTDLEFVLSLLRPDRVPRPSRESGQPPRAMLD